MKTYKYIAILKIKKEVLMQNGMNTGLVWVLRSNSIDNLKKEIKSWTSAAWDLERVLEDGRYIKINK